MLVYKPHTLTKKTAVEGEASDVRTQAVRSGSTTFAGLVDTRTPQSAFDAYGVECRRPAVLYCEAADATFRAGDYLAYLGSDWIVRTDPQRSDGHPATAHAHCLIDLAEPMI